MYFLRRLLLLPFSLLLLSLLCFGLRELTPGDPVASALPPGDSRLAATSPAAYDRVYQRAAVRLNRQLPPFYFSVRNGALPDTLHRIVRPAERDMLRALTLVAGNWEGVSDYYRTLRQTAYPSSTATDRTPAESLVALRLLQMDDPEQITATLQQMDRDGQAPELIAAHNRAMNAGSRSRLLGIKVAWNGTQNQYHQWLTDLLTGDLGVSYLDRQPVSAKIARALPWTLLLNFLAVLLMLVISVPLGLYLAGNAGSTVDRITTVLLFLLFGIPAFWTATLLANFFTTPAYGMDFFPSMGLGNLPADAGWWETLTVRGSHLFLPVVCLAYPALAYVSRHLRQSTLVELGKDYVNTARLKGLTERQIRWRHVFRNASFPLITIFGGLFPRLLAGSVVIERIFNLPGMGQLLYVSAVDGDWPVVIVLVLLIGVLTALGLLVADLLYALVDPRVNLNRAPLKQPSIAP
ncbi:ABC transporter permease [Lewinella sp. 4G2]|uniref:ABC transporter permease n=1 Tax=Lewinella sp. 4G2 TaxID=1803372 RepID=UPI0007B4D444|nr:ABC transporter permease [Lewinella sp. 4G2]OAV46115.1 hypothetical protein A3850_017800 [Lewinella sp. 4G2]